MTHRLRSRIAAFLGWQRSVDARGTTPADWTLRTMTTHQTDYQLDVRHSAAAAAEGYAELLADITAAGRPGIHARLTAHAARAWAALLTEAADVADASAGRTREPLAAQDRQERMTPEERHEALLALDECVAALTEAATAIGIGDLETAFSKLSGVVMCGHEICGALSCAMAGEKTIAKWRELAEAGRVERQRGQTKGGCVVTYADEIGRHMETLRRMGVPEGAAQQLAPKLAQLAVANNILQGAQGAVDAAMMAISSDDELSSHARSLCKQFRDRLAIYMRHGR